MSKSRVLVAVLRVQPLTSAEIETLSQVLDAYGGAVVRCYQGSAVQILPPPIGQRSVVVWPAPVEIAVDPS